jgi:membrane-bound metal-dependent hydrolase YbcI (DUF457 family)
MRRTTHLILGGIVFTAYAWLIHHLVEIPGEILLAGFLAALLGSVAPDVLEPARHGGHRSLCHSRRAMRLTGGVFLLSAALGAFQPVIPALSFLLSGFLLGYALHLLADGMTPAGLPE